MDEDTEYDEPIDWSDDDRIIDEQLEAERVKRNVCIRPRPRGTNPCAQGYDHTGHCDWWTSPTVTSVLEELKGARG